MWRGGVGVGSHSRSHPASLPALPDNELERELAGSRRTIEGLLDAPVEHFAYPHSRVDARVERAVESAGYRLACAGVGTRFTRFCLHRVEPPAVRGPAIEATVAWRRLKRLVRREQGRLRGRP